MFLFCRSFSCPLRNLLILTPPALLCCRVQIDEDAMKAQAQEAIEKITSLVKHMVLSKMDLVSLRFAKALVEVVEKTQHTFKTQLEPKLQAVGAEVDEAVGLVDPSSQMSTEKGRQEVRDKTFENVEQSYALLVEQVSVQVSSVIGILSSMMETEDENNDDAE